MAGANRVYIQVDIGSASAEANIKNVNKGIEQLGDTSKKATEKGSAGFKSFGVAIEQTNRQVTQLVQGLAGLAIVRLGVEMIKMGDAIKRTQMSFEAMTGSAAEATEMMSKLRDIAKNRVFGFQDIADAAIRLKALGFATAEIPRDIAAITGAVQRMGRGAETVELLTHALGVMREKGVAQAAQLFRQIAAQGVDVMEIIRTQLEKEMGRVLSTSEIRNLIENGRLAGEATAEAIIAGLETLKPADKMMDTISARFQKFRDELGFAAEKIDSDITPAVNRLLGVVTKLVDAFKEATPETRHWIEMAALVGTGVLVAPRLIGAGASLVGALAGPTVQATRSAYGTSRAAYQIYQEAQALAPGGAGMGKWQALLATIGLMPAAEVALVGFTAALSGFVAYLGSSIVKEAILRLGILTGPGQMFEPRKPGTYTGFRGEVTTTPPSIIGIESKAKRDLALAALPLVGGVQPPEYRKTPEDQLRILQANEKLIKEQIEESKAVLARANEQLYQGPAAVQYRLQQQIAKNREALGGPNIEAERNLYKAAAIETSRILKEMRDKDLENQKNADKEMLQSRIEAVKDATRFQAEMADAVVKDTAVKAADAELARLDIIKRGAEEERQLRRQLADEDYEYQKNKIEREAAIQQITLAKLKTKATPEEKKQITGIQLEYASETQHQLDILAGKHRADESKADVDAAKETQAAIADIVKQSAADTTALLKQARAITEQEQIDSAERQIAIMRLKYVDGDAQTARDKIAEIRRATAFEIQAAEHVAEEKREIARRHIEEDIAGLETKARGLEARGELQAAQDLRDQETAAQQAFYAADYAAYSELQDRKTLLALQAQKQINEEWINEQRQVFEKFEAGVGQVFDAMFKKGKDMWHTLANMAMDAGKQLLKALVVPSMSAALMTAMGMPVQLQPKGDFGPGLFGQLAQRFSQKPVFSKPPQLDIPELHDLSFTPDKRLRVDASGSETKSYDRHDYNITYKGSGPVPPPLIGPGGPPLPPLGFPFAIPPPPGGGAPGSRGEMTSSSITFQDIEGGGTTYQVPPAYYPPGGGGGGGAWSFAQAGLQAAGGGGGSWSSNMFNTALGLAGGYQGQQQSAVAQLAQMPLAGGGMSINNLVKVAGSKGLFSGLKGAFGGAGGNAALASALGPVALMGGISAIRGSYSLGQYMQNKNVPGAARGLMSGALGAFGGLAVAGGLAAMFPSLMVPLLAAGPIGLIAAAGIGAAIGLYGAFHTTDQQHARQLIKQMYGVDISNMQVLNAVVQIAKQKYGGAISLAVASPEVQQLINLYAASQGMNKTVGPRPMYAAQYMQQGGGLMQQPVYSNGVMVANPYAGTTTQQYSQWSQEQANPQFRNNVYVQLDPSAASSLFQGQVVNVLNSNPGVVGNANTTAIASGNNRTAQLGGLLEPSTVTS